MRILVISSIFFLLIGALILVPFEEGERINGVSLVSPPRKVEASRLEGLKRINAGWVAVIPYGFSRSGQPSVTFDHERQWWGERTEGTRELIKYASDLGMKVMLKPHVWVLGEGWTGDFTLDSEAEWEKWENDFRKYILNHARVATALKVDMFCIGTEYRTPARERPEFWRSLIAEVKKIYKGPITYAANWDNYEKIEWWDAVDYIGIDSYFPLAEGDDPSLAEIKEGWIPLKKQLKAFSQRWGKQILFTEYGFQSAKGGAGKHWEVDKSIENEDMQIQSKAYEATFQSVWNESWFAGGFLWKWHLTTRGAQMNRTRFTPQGKPAEKVIAKWYEKSS